MHVVKSKYERSRLVEGLERCKGRDDVQRSSDPGTES